MRGEKKKSSHEMEISTGHSTKANIFQPHDYSSRFISMFLFYCYKC